jgi:hypothetical protein
MTPALLVVGKKRGRQPRAGVRATKRVEIVITETERAELEIVARENGQRVSSLVRDAVNTYVADYRDKDVF